MICPHCGKPVHRAPEELLILISKLNLGRREHALAMAILKDYPNPVPSPVLVKRMWTEEEMGSFKQKIKYNFHSHVSVLRRILKATRWTIVKMKFRGYRFELAMDSKEVKQEKEKEKEKVSKAA